MNKKLLIKVLFCLTFLIGMGGNTYGQFLINETFRGKTTNPEHKVVFSGDPVASLTASTGGDPEGDGWLRLTPNDTHKKGAVFIDTEFPSTHGVIIEFEYKTWSPAPNGTYPNGGDGIGFFLFDGAIDETSFELGNVGGSLGYAPGGTTQGLKGGYLGLGLDEFGNYSSSENGKHTDSSLGNEALPNRIALRGVTDRKKPNTESNLLLKSIPLNIDDHKAGTINYAQVTATRPTDLEFYRKVQIEIQESNGGNYTITARWAVEPNGKYYDIFEHVYNEAPPKTLKLGFAASTGGAINYHEIRNLFATTPGGVTITKSVNLAVANVDDPLTYQIDLLSQNANDDLTFKVNDIISPDFEVQSIKFINYGNGSSSLFNDGDLKLDNIEVTLKPLATASFIITGKVKSLPENGMLVNTATINESSLPPGVNVSPEQLRSTVETQIIDPDLCSYNGDAFISGYHTTIVKTLTGFEIFGEMAAADGTSNVLSPIKITPANGYKYAGRPLMATMGSKGKKLEEGVNDTQSFLLTTKGLYTWGKSGTVVNTGTSEFSAIDLPKGVDSSSISYMTASYGTLVLLVDGVIYTRGTNPSNYGDYGSIGTTGGDESWHNVNYIDNKVLNVKNVKSVKIHALGGFALLEDNSLIEWGKKKINATTNNDLRAVILKELPNNEIPTMIAITGSDKDTEQQLTYYVLSKTGKVYSLGDNALGQLGIGSKSNNRFTTWQTVNVSKDTVLSNIVFIAASDNSRFEATAGAIDESGKLYLWGSNERGMAGQEYIDKVDDKNKDKDKVDSTKTVNYATVPLGFLDASGKVSNPAVYLEVGGHTAMYMNEDKRFCYVGHKINGSMGDGKHESEFVSTFDCENTPLISDMCASIEIVPELSLNLVKTAEVDEDVEGDYGNGIITYTFTVTNKSSVSVKLTELIDPKFLNGKVPGFKETFLLPNEVEVFTAIYSISDEDIEKGEVVNQAVVKGEYKDKVVEAKSGTEVDNTKPTVTPVEGGGPLMTNPHIYHKVQ